MTHIITGLCLRDGSCVDVCPVECIIPGNPLEEYPTYYIDPETCIDCGACVPECPYSAIYPEDEVPTAYSAKEGEFLNRVGLTEHYEGQDKNGEIVSLDSVRKLETAEAVDLSPDIQANYDYFEKGPGYSAAD